MVASISENNIRKFFELEGYLDVRVFGFRWNTDYDFDNSWFVFTCDGVSGRWYVGADEGSDVFRQVDVVPIPDIVRIASPSDWSHISPGRSSGLVGHDFRGCYMGGFDFSYSKFVDCIFDDICMSPKPSNTPRAKFIGCKWRSSAWSSEWRSE